MTSKVPDGRNRRILVIDDNRAIHDDFRKILSPGSSTAAALDASEAALFGRATNSVQMAEFEVDSAYQGQDGVLLAQQALEAGRPYALAFVDVRMPPGWDGVETTRNLWELDPDLQIVLCSAYSDYSWDEVFEKLGQRDALLILKKPFDSVEAVQLAHALTEKWWLHRESRRKMDELEHRVSERTMELRQTNSALQDEVVEHQRTETSLRESEKNFQDLAENITDVFWIRSYDGKTVYYASPAYERVWGRSRDGLYSNPRDWVDAVISEERQEVAAVFAGLGPDRMSVSIEYRIVRPNGEVRWIHDRGFVTRNPSGREIRHIGIATDITDRMRLEAQLLQSQKMETVGKLAGGVAHEFNSILTAIIGQSELLLADLPPNSPLAVNVTEIRKAAGRAAALTRQLLAYGRKQILQPECLNLNQIVAGMEGLFQNLMGGRVNMRIVPDSDLRSVRADAGQIEQVIMNLAMNSRDAMPNGGMLTMETSNVSIDRESLGRFPELNPGEYVMLAITDTGVGMSAEVKAHVFDPFFSTKGVGEGTGLGLSTCYGIVKQSGGHISVYSEPGRGTTFKMYLPQAELQPRAPDQSLDPAELPRGTETILLVEDDPALREMAAILLRRLGYTVTVAADGIEALNLKQKPGSGHIDMLFTDVVMPHMSGKELSDRVRVLYPRTRILFTSAYTENAIEHQSMLSKGVALLQKPFTPSALAHKLREVLDQPNPAI